MTVIKRKAGKAGLYIHIPFCLKKCRYCGFLSFEAGSGRQSAYMKALIKELELYGKEKPAVDSLFIGGGTPSLMSPAETKALMEAARQNFLIEEKAEITIEANPKTLTKDKLSAYKSLGINRLSIGAQSMDNGLLAALGRIHSREDFLENFQAARAAGFDNINVDLMFGLPGQTEAAWEDSLRQILSLSPEHISFYSLQLEEETEFYRRYKDGRLELPPEDEERLMYHRGLAMVREAGYRHYEISNCARPGFECRHNLKYWNFDPYIGAGLGAHSFRYDRGRSFHTDRLDTYIRETAAGRLPVAGGGRGTAKDYMGEYVFTALRKTEGVDIIDFQKTFGTDFFQAYGEQSEKLLEYRKKGLLTLERGRLALTEAGIDCSNRIMAEFV